MFMLVTWPAVIRSPWKRFIFSSSDSTLSPLFPLTSTHKRNKESLERKQGNQKKKSAEEEAHHIGGDEI